MDTTTGSFSRSTPRASNMRDNTGSSPELRMVLVGKIGVGKSASGNTILGKKVFTSRASDTSVTNVCEKGEGEVSGRRVVVVDTPAFGTDLSLDEVIEEKCIALSDPGPHAILLVIEVGRFTGEDKRTVETILRRYGDGAGRYTMVLFTNRDKLGEKMIEEFIQGASKELQELVEKCGGRYHSFNNKNMSDRTQVTELLEKIDRMMEDNGGSHYTSEMNSKMRKMSKEHICEKMDVQEQANDKPNKSGSLSSSTPQASNMSVNTGSLSSSTPQASNMRDNAGSLSSSTPQASNMSVNTGSLSSSTPQASNMRDNAGSLSSSTPQASNMSVNTGSLSRSTPQASNMRDNAGSLSSSTPQASNMSVNTGSLSRSTPQASNMRDNAELKIVLLGKTGVGKSAAGNTILGRREFDSKLSSTSITNKCKKGTAVVAGRRIAVIDTPSLFGTDLTADQIEQEIEKCISLSAPGPHALLLVLQVGRYTQREREAVKNIFGESAARYMMVLFTHGDSLEDGMTIEKYIKGVEGDLQQLIDECGGRYHVFNNKDKSNTAQAIDLVKEIEAMVETNCGRYYTMEIYNKAAASTSQIVEMGMEEVKMERSQYRLLQFLKRNCHLM